MFRQPYQKDQLYKVKPCLDEIASNVCATEFLCGVNRTFAWALLHHCWYHWGIAILHTGYDVVLLFCIGCWLKLALDLPLFYFGFLSLGFTICNFVYTASSLPGKDLPPPVTEENTGKSLSKSFLLLFGQNFSME